MMELVLGHSAAEAIGRSLDIVVPETHREWHWAGYRRTMETGESKYDGQLFVDPMVHADGTIHSHRGRLYLVRDPEGTVVGVMTIWTAASTEPGDSKP